MRLLKWLRMLSRLANRVCNLQIVSLNFLSLKKVLNLSEESLRFRVPSMMQPTRLATFYGHIIHNLAIKTGNRILSTNK